MNLKPNEKKLSPNGTLIAFWRSFNTSKHGTNLIITNISSPKKVFWIPFWWTHAQRGLVLETRSFKCYLIKLLQSKMAE